MSGKRADRWAVAAVTGSMLVVGWWLWRGRHRFEPLAPTYDFDKSRNTRHMVRLSSRVSRHVHSPSRCCLPRSPQVEMHRRVDRDALKAWLDSTQDEGGERTAES